MATSIGFDIFAKDDASATFLKVAASAKLLNSTVDDLRTNFLGLGKLVGGTSLVPVLAGASGALVELTTSAAAGGLALGVLGVSAVGILSSMKKAQLALQATNLALSKLTPGTTQYAAKLKELHAQQFAFNKTFGPAAKGYNDMTNAFTKFKDQTGKGGTLDLLHQGMELIAGVLPKLVPVSNAAAHAVSGLLGELTAWTKGPEFDAVLKWLETSGPKAITAFGNSLGHTIHGIGGFLANFIGPGNHAAKTMERLSGSFDKWANSKGVSASVDRFLRYMHDNGPKIDSTLSSLAQSAPKIASAIGKLGGANLTVTSRFLNMIAGLPQGAFNAIADSLFAIAAASKLIAIGKGIGAIGALGKTFAGGLGGASGAGGAAGALGVQKVWVVNMGEGGLGGGAGGVASKEGWFSRAFKPVSGALGAAGLSAGTAAAAATAGIAAGVGIAKVYADHHFNVLLNGPMGLNTLTHAFSGHNIIPQGGGPTGYFSRYDPFSGQGKAPAKTGPALKSVTNGLDAIKAHAAQASRALDMIGVHGEQTSRKAVKAIQALNGNANGIDSIKARAARASQEIDQIGPHAQQTSAKAVEAIGLVNSQLAHIHDRSFKINADTSQAMANLSAMRYQVDQLHNKTIIIRAIGGHVPGEPTGGTGGGAGGGMVAGSGGGASRSSGSGFHSAARNVLSGLFPGITGHGVGVGNVLNRLGGAISNTRGRLQSLTSARNSFAGGFQNFASSVFGANYGTDPTTGADIPPTIASILAMQQGQATQAHSVRLNVKSLLRKGLSPALLKQMQAAGQSGIAEINALASASPAQIAQLNSLNKQTSGDLKAAGMSAANRLYGQGIKQASKDMERERHVLTEIRDLLKHERQGKHVVSELRIEGTALVAVLKKTHRQTGQKAP